MFPVARCPYRAGCRFARFGRNFRFFQPSSARWTRSSTAIAERFIASNKLVLMNNFHFIAHYRTWHCLHSDTYCTHWSDSGADSWTTLDCASDLRWQKQSGRLLTFGSREESFGFSTQSKKTTTADFQTHHCRTLINLGVQGRCFPKISSLRERSDESIHDGVSGVKWASYLEFVWWTSYYEPHKYLELIWKTKYFETYTRTPHVPTSSQPTFNPTFNQRVGPSPGHCLAASPLMLLPGGKYVICIVLCWSGFISPREREGKIPRGEHKQHYTTPGDAKIVRGSNW